MTATATAPARAEARPTSASSSPATPSAAGERVIYGQRVLGVVRLVDDPADGARPPLRHRARADRDGRARSDRRRLPRPGRPLEVIPAAGPCSWPTAPRSTGDDRPPPPRPRRARRADRAGPRDRDARRPLHRAPRAPRDAVRPRPARRSPPSSASTAVDALRTVLACYEAMRAYADQAVPLEP